MCSLSSCRPQDSVCPTTAPGSCLCARATGAPSDNRPPLSPRRTPRLRGVLPRDPQDPPGPPCNCGHARRGTGNPGEEKKTADHVHSFRTWKPRPQDQHRPANISPTPLTSCSRPQERNQEPGSICPTSRACLPSGFESRSGKPRPSSLLRAQPAPCLPLPRPKREHRGPPVVQDAADCEASTGAHPHCLPLPHCGVMGSRRGGSQSPSVGPCEPSQCNRYISSLQMEGGVYWGFGNSNNGLGPSA